MEYGYICFAYSKNEWIAKAIASITDSEWSHCFITIPPILDQEMALEDATGGIEPILFDIGYRNNPNQKYEVYRVKIDKNIIDESIIKCFGLLQEPYGYLAYPWFIWRAINLFFGKDIKRQDNWYQKYRVCSGLDRFYLENCILPSLFKDFGKGSSNAQDTYQIVKTYPELFELIEKKD